MGLLDTLSVRERRVCPLFILLPTSGAMAGSPLGAINSAMTELFVELNSMNNDNPDVEVKIGVMTYDNETRWFTPGLVNPDAWIWNDLDAGGMLSLGMALIELAKVLSVKHGFMNHSSGYVAPAFILLVEGEPIDNYHDALLMLKGNNWYKVGIKVAIGYGNTNEALLCMFTEHPETVLHADEPHDLKRMINFAVMTSLQELIVPKGRVAKAGLPDRTDDVLDAFRDAYSKESPTLPKNLTEPDEEW